MTIGIALILTSLTIIGKNIKEDFNGAQQSAELVKQVKNYSTYDNSSTPNNQQTFSSPKDMESININGLDIIGTLYIPCLELELPVSDNCNDTLLKQAPCRYTGSIYTNNLIIAAHNYNSHFGNIYTLENGDKINFIDVNGHSYSFEVVDIETIEGNDVQRMLSNDWDLTLFTCTWDSKSRTTVRCKYIENTV